LVGAIPKNLFSSRDSLDGACAPGGCQCLQAILQVFILFGCGSAALGLRGSIPTGPARGLFQRQKDQGRSVCPSHLDPLTSPFPWPGLVQPRIASTLLRPTQSVNAMPCLLEPARTSRYSVELDHVGDAQFAIVSSEVTIVAFWSDRTPNHQINLYVPRGRNRFEISVRRQPPPLG
jgi:hypothetical protein